MPKKTTSPVWGMPTGLSERVAYVALLAVPAIVPIAVSKPPFTVGPALTLNPSVFPKLFTFSVIVGIALVSWAIGVIRGTISTRSIPLVWWLAAFLGLSTVSTFAGMHPSTSFFGSGYQATGLLVLLLGSSLFFLVVQLICTADRIRALSWSAVAGGVLVAAVGLLQVVGADPLRLGLAYNYGWLRVGSLLGNSDFAGSYLVVPLIIAAALSLSAKETVARAIGSVSFAMILLCLLSTGTRGAWAGAVVGLAVLGVVHVRGAGKITRSTYAAIGLAVGLPLAWALVNAKSLLIRFADLSQADAVGGGRIPIWGEALRMIAARPLFGTGPDAYRLGWYAVRTAAWAKAIGGDFAIDDPHNVILLFGATLGIPATIAAIGLVVSAVVTSAGFALRRDANPSRRVYTGWWAALIGLAVTLLFTVNTVTIVALVFIALGVVVTVRSKPVDWPRPVGRLLAIAAIVLGLAAGTVGTLYVAADALLMAAAQSPDRIAIAEQAARLAPWYSEARYTAAETRAAATAGALEAGAATAPQDAQLVEKRFEQLVAFNPHNPQFRVAQAHFLASAGQYLGPDMLRRAVAAGRAASEINRFSSRAANFTALAQFRLGDPQAAATTLEPVWEIDPKYPDPGVLYMQALLSAGDRAGAVAVLATLQQRFPGNEQVARLGSLLETPTAAP